MQVVARAVLPSEPSGRWMRSVAGVRTHYGESSPLPLISRGIQDGHTSIHIQDGRVFAMARLLKSEWKRKRVTENRKTKIVFWRRVSTAERNALLVCTGDDTGKVYPL